MGPTWDTPTLVFGLKLRSLAAEILDYFGDFRRAREMVASAARSCENALREHRADEDLAARQPVMLQCVWLLLQGGLSEYRSGSYDAAFRVFALCGEVIDSIAPRDGVKPRWGTRARIDYSMGLVHRERYDLDSALKCFTASTESAYRSLDYATRSTGSDAKPVSWLMNVAIARSIGMGLASVHGAIGRTDHATPLLLASRAMLPKNEVFISTHIDMLRLNMLLSSTVEPEGLAKIIAGLEACHTVFSETAEHPLYRARAAQSLVRAYLHFNSTLNPEGKAHDHVQRCRELLSELESTLSGDDRFPLHRMAAESRMACQQPDRGNWQKAETIATAGLGRILRASQPAVFIELSLARGEAREKLGNLRGAAEDYTNGLLAAEKAGGLRQKANFLLHLCRVRWNLGEIGKARRLYTDYLSFQKIAKVATGDVVRLEQAVEHLMQERSDVFYLSLNDEFPKYPKAEIARLKSFLVRWSKNGGESDAVAARKLRIERSTLSAWKAGARGRAE